MSGIIQPEGQRRTPAIRGNVLTLGIVSFLVDVSSEMIYVFLPAFVTGVLGAGKSFLGFLMGFAEFAASILKLFSGWFADKLGRRKTLVVAGYLLSAVSKPFLAVANAAWQVFLVRLSDRAGKGIRTAPRDALLADSTPEAFRGRAFGFHRAMDSLGAVVGPGLAYFIVQRFPESYRPLFWIAAVPAFIAVMILIFFVREEKRARTAPVAPPRLSFKGVDKPLALFLVTVSLFSLGNSSDAFLILRARDFRITGGLLALWWMAFNIIYTAFSYPAGALADRIGRKRILLAGYIIYALVYLGFAFAGRAVHIWVLMAIYGAYYGLTEGVQRTLVADYAPAGRRGTIFGLYHGLTGLLLFLASLLGGALWDLTGPRGTFVFGAVLAGAAAIIFGFGFRERQPAER